MPNNYPETHVILKEAINVRINNIGSLGPGILSQLHYRPRTVWKDWRRFADKRQLEAVVPLIFLRSEIKLNSSYSHLRRIDSG